MHYPLRVKCSEHTFLGARQCGPRSDLFVSLCAALNCLRVCWVVGDRYETALAVVTRCNTDNDYLPSMRSQLRSILPDNV